MPSRRLALIAFGLTAAFGLAPLAPAAAATKARPAKLPAAAADMSLGSPRAKVQVVEYASLSCPHCARFNNDVFPAFKSRYVDSGQVRYTLREMLTPPAEVAAAGFMMARCAGPSHYFKVVDAVFKSQPHWEDGKIKPLFLQIAKDNGLDEARFDACLNSKEGLAALRSRVAAAVAAGVDSTPTFFINGKKYQGELTQEQLDAAIAEAKKGG